MDQLKDSTVGNILLGERSRLQDWTGTPTELLAALTKVAPKKLAHSAAWPKSPGWLTNELRRIAPQLRMHGISVAFSRNVPGRVLSTTKLQKLQENSDMRKVT